MRISDWSSDVCSSDLDRLLGDFAQSDYRVFVPVTIDRQFRTARNLTSALTGQQHQIKSVGNLVNAIFNGDARHVRTPNSPIRERKAGDRKSTRLKSSH